MGRKHSRTWKLTDVNYIAASQEAQRSIFTAYCGALNALPTDATAKITIVNHRLNPAEFERRILLPYKGDWLDHFREEANQIMRDRSRQSNNLVQERYITLSIAERKIEESRAYFRRVESNLNKSFSRLDSGLKAISNYERLRILHDFFRPGQEQYFQYDDAQAMRRGTDFRELICPDGMCFRKNHFEMGDKYGRVLFLRSYASFVADDLISDLTEFSRNLMLSIDLIPVPTDEAVKEVESIILGVETDITRWQQRQNAKNNFTAEVPRTMEQKRENSREYMDDLTMR
ncbi:MAG: TraE family protein, partial [Clostridiales bacterium]|nr:TraE family protein [Clostridiales bacterium]